MGPQGWLNGGAGFALGFLASERAAATASMVTLRLLAGLGTLGGAGSRRGDSPDVKGTDELRRGLLAG